MTVSRHHRAPPAIRVLIRGRGTAQSGMLGAVILAARTGYLPEQTCLPVPVAGRLATLVVTEYPRSLPGQ
jgi:hypothetical protein